MFTWQAVHTDVPGRIGKLVMRPEGKYPGLDCFSDLLRDSVNPEALISEIHHDPQFLLLGPPFSSHFGGRSWQPAACEARSGGLDLNYYERSDGPAAGPLVRTQRRNLRGHIYRQREDLKCRIRSQFAEKVAGRNLNAGLTLAKQDGDL